MPGRHSPQSQTSSAWESQKLARYLIRSAQAANRRSFSRPHFGKACRKAHVIPSCLGEPEVRWNVDMVEGAQRPGTTGQRAPQLPHRPEVALRQEREKLSPPSTLAFKRRQERGLLGGFEPKAAAEAVHVAPPLPQGRAFAPTTISSGTPSLAGTEVLTFTMNAGPSLTISPP